MTPDEEREIRRRDEAIGNVFALDQTATADRRYLLAALDEARRERDAALAREARLREAADAFRHDTFAGTPGVTERLDAALADPTATTWLADRERAAALQAAGAAWAIAAPDRQVAAAAAEEAAREVRT